MKESTTRSVAKTISWRVTVSIISFVISYWLTGSLELAGMLMASKVVVNSIWYFIHERLWNKINFGKQDNKADE
jgi:uncharacterized membrane protein